MTTAKYLILCDNASKRPNSGQEVLKLELGEGKDRIHLKSSDIKKMFTDNLSPVMKDLVEIATYVYVSGQLTTRGGIKEFEYGAKWYRHFEMIVPVRELNVWNEQKELLEQILEFVSGERYTFEFLEKTIDDNSYFDFKEGLKPEEDYTDVVLLSGGLDSFTGAMEEIALKHKTIFVSHQPETKVTSLQNNVFKYVEEHSNRGKMPFHVPVKIFKGGKYVTKDTNQRNRSFLFAALGAMVADCLGLDEVKFYENGIISCNLPFDRQTYQAQRTRSTHPKFLKQMDQLLSNILGHDFRFCNPFFTKTRSEVVNRLLDLQHQDGIGKTRSCASSRYCYGWRHDGTCSQCVDRRFATLANDCLDYDIWDDYRLNIFTDELEKTQERTIVYNYTAMAQRISKIPDSHRFSDEYSSDLIEIVNYMGISRKEGIEQIYNLYKRHSKSVLGVLASQVGCNAKEFAGGVLPANCLLRLIALDKPPKIRTRKTKKKTSKISAKGFTQWKRPGDACFVIDGSRIRFYYNDELKDLRLSSGSQASDLLVSLTEAMLTQEEVKEMICSPKTKPADAIKNVNRTLNTKIKSLGFDIPDNIKFIALENRNKQYYCTLLIKTKSEL